MSILPVAVVTWLVIGFTSACFCPIQISSSCGCGGGGYPAYSGGSYGGSYAQGYAQPYAQSYAQPQAQAGYATFFRDLTPFRQPYYPAQQQPYPQYYPRPAPALPPMYQMPNPRYIAPAPAPAPRPMPQYIARPVVAPTLIQEKQVYLQPAATVAPIVESPRTTLHDNSYGQEEEVVTQAPVAPVAPVVTTTQAPATVDEVPDFVDEAPVKSEKEEFYYVYYDDKGNKVGDSRSGSTFAPENVIEEVTTVAPAPAHVEITTQVPHEEANQNYDDIVEETQVPVRTSFATPEFVTSTTVLFMEPSTVTQAPSGKEGEVVYEDETVEYEDNGEETTGGPIAKKPTSSGGYKRTVQDNQIMVDAAENTGEGYRGRRIAANGVKIIKRYPKDKRKIHEN